VTELTTNTRWKWKF